MLTIEYHLWFCKAYEFIILIIPLPYESYGWLVKSDNQFLWSSVKSLFGLFPFYNFNSRPITPKEVSFSLFLNQISNVIYPPIFKNINIRVPHINSSFKSQGSNFLHKSRNFRYVEFMNKVVLTSLCPKFMILRLNLLVLK